MWGAYAASEASNCCRKRCSHEQEGDRRRPGFSNTGFAPTRKFHVCVARTEAPVILPSVQVRFKLLLLRISPRIVQTLTRFVSHTRALVAVAGFLRFFEVSAELCVGDCRLAGLALGGARGGGGPRGRFLAVGTRLCARCRPKS
jgi:hypothetical protein